MIHARTHGTPQEVHQLPEGIHFHFKTRPIIFNSLAFPQNKDPERAFSSIAVIKKR